MLFIVYHVSRDVIGYEDSNCCWCVSIRLFSQLSSRLLLVKLSVIRKQALHFQWQARRAVKLYVSASVDLSRFLQMVSLLAGYQQRVSGLQRAGWPYILKLSLLGF